MENDYNNSVKGNPVIRRLAETLTFFRAYFWDIGKFLLYATFPVIIIENFISYYALVYNLPQEVKHLPILVHFLYQPIYTGGLICLIARIAADETWSMKECLLAGLGCWVNLLFVNIISSFLIVFGLFAFILPGLLIFARLSLAEFIVVLDRFSFMDALHRSYEISKGLTWQIIGSGVLLSAILLALQLLLHFTIASFSLQSLPAFMVSELLVIVLWSTFTVLLFRFYGLATKTSQKSDDSDVRALPLN